MEMTEVQYEASVLAGGGTLINNEFPAFRQGVAQTIENNLAKYGAAIFTTSTKHLSSAYVAHFATDHEKQHHDCAACRDFIRNFGTAVVIDENNRPRSLMWDPEAAPETFKASVAKLKELAERGVIRGAMRFDILGTAWGHEMKGGWSHLYYHFDKIDLTARMSEIGVSLAAARDSRENFTYLRANVEKFPSDVVRKAAQLLASGRINRKDKFADWVNWILDVTERYEAIPAKNSVERNSIIWAAVIRLPAPGWASYAGSMPGMMFEMIQDGRADPAIIHRFNEASDSLNYQRGTSELSEGQADAAEKLIEKLGLAPALERRFATIDELDPIMIWKQPAPVEKPAAQSNGIFGSLVGKKPGETDDASPSINDITKAAPMSLTKFIKEHLPGAEEVYVFVNNGAQPIAQFITALEPAAPPILRWDKARADRGDSRFPICWNMRVNGIQPSALELTPGWIKVNAFAKAPWLIENFDKQFGQSIGLILDGAKSYETSYDLFPEAILADLHPIRDSMNAYNSSKHLARGSENVVAALAVNSQAAFLQLKVKSRLGWMLYSIERFE